MYGKTVLRRELTAKIGESKAGRLIVQCSELYVLGFLVEKECQE